MDRQYLEELKTTAKQIFPKATFEWRIVRFSHTYLRIFIEENIFIDIYLNADTGRKDFSLIHGEKRLFGYDNLGGWHCHPCGNVKKHESCDEPLIQTVFEKMKQIVEDI